MLSSALHADVVIVGAGIAGLSAAHRLAGAGVTVSVLEAAPRPGGRMATEEIDGFRLDRNGQLLNTSYAELLSTPYLSGVDLSLFSPGILVHSEKRLHRMGEPGSAWGALTAARAPKSAPRTARSAFSPRSSMGGPLGQARVSTALSRLAGTPVDRLLARPEQSAREALRSYGFPARTVSTFLRPLLSALLCDPGLGTSSRCAELALRGFARGRLCLPVGGVGTLPERLAATLPTGTVRTGIHVTSASISSVTTEELGRLDCRALLIATDAREAARLLPGLRVPDFHPVTVVHHAAPRSPLAEAALLLDADRAGPVSHTAVISEVDRTRAPRGRALISSTVLGLRTPPPGLDAMVRAQLAGVYGTPTDDWELLAVHHDPRAVPAMSAPHDARRAVRLLAGLYVCGDHRDTSTVQGALHSGRRAADQVMRDFGIKPDITADPVPLAA
ncbi:NAD(P)/FAD-dependent oxidoreductase [Streptomyces sp. NPDC051320]|uniref:NAD(P)/FAD-dependent oxidoreductase n=1 Tax=Streptomyces sp. NPDC051320 TaxID=3154644 RepID=UPI00343133C3